MTGNLPVAGHCPMGCGETLQRRTTDGAIVCASPACVRPDAVDELLRDRETEHIVQFDPAGFTIRHPLRERLDDDLMRCALHRSIAELLGPPNGEPGRYRATRGPGGWRLTASTESSDR
ncbi:DUF6085 family protein [Streptomyces sp. NPDC094153]|uniref:DUF6085 family protein n=1 Tax=Streptomyces sp. NPDC094153 TaxID=3366058 RepID=UPI003826F9BA